MSRPNHNKIAVSIISTCILLSLSVTWNALQAQEEMTRYFIGLIYKGDEWKSIPPEKEIEIQRGHRANIDRLIQNGQMVLAGPIENAGELRGIFIYRTRTLEEAQALATTDPAVQAARLRIEVYPFWGPKVLQELLIK